ncbi:hypothetical protein FHG87_007920 [Trinorchestia longiramus]|nr:hypothetical protein FHG87_007920 [Trinorchestia longiramus]
MEKTSGMQGVHQQRSGYQSWQQVSQTASYVQQTADSYQSFETSTCSYSTAAHAAQNASQSTKVVTEPVSEKAVKSTTDPPQEQDDTEDEELHIDEGTSRESPTGDVLSEQAQRLTVDEQSKEKAETTSTDGNVSSIIQSDVLQKLIMESVKKYLSETPLLANIEPSKLLNQLDTSAIAQSISATKNESANDDKTMGDVKKKRLYRRPPGIPDYKPTPIKELQRRKSTEKSNDKLPRTSDQESEVTDFSSAEDEVETESDRANPSIKESQAGELQSDLKASSKDTCKLPKKSSSNDSLSKEKDTKRVSDKIECTKGDAISSKSQGSSHVLVPAVAQVTRKAWTPAAVKASKTSGNAPCMLEAVLQVLDGPTADDENKSEICTDQPEKKADLNKERESLSSLSTEKTSTEALKEKKASGDEDASKATDSNQSDSLNDPAVATETLKEEIVTEKESKKIDDDQMSASESENSIRDRSLSRDSRSSSSRERRKRRKRRKREKKMKRKHSKSKKRKRRYSSSFEANSGSDFGNEDEHKEIDDLMEVKKEKNVNNEDEGSSCETQSQHSTKSQNKRYEEESDYSTSKRSRSKSKRRKHSKHRKKSKKKHKKRRYHSSSSVSSNNDYESSSGDESDRRSRKRRRSDIDFSVVKPDPEDVIDLTVIKDESESDEAPITISLKKEKTCDAPVASELPKTMKGSDGVNSFVKEEKKEADNATVPAPESDTRKSKSRTTSIESSTTIPSDGKQQDLSPTPGFSPEDAPELSPSAEEADLIPPPASDVPAIEKPAAVFSSKTKTLKEISIFDSLMDGTASSLIKTVKKKRVEEHSSSSITPTVTDDDDHLKVTKTVTSRSSTTSTRHSSSDGRSSKISTNSHVSKSVKSHSSPSPSSSSSSSSRHSSFKSKSDLNGTDRDRALDKTKSKDSSSNAASSSSSKHKHSSNSSIGGSKNKSESSDKINSGSSKSNSGIKSNSSSYKSSSGSHRASSTSKSSSQGSSKSSSHSSSRHHSSSSLDHKSGTQSTRDKVENSPRPTGLDGSLNSTSAASQPACAVSSQESEGISDREFFNFNNGPSHTSQSSDEDVVSADRYCFSPLPDLSALDTIPEEDWHQLTTLDHDKGPEAAEDECLQLYNDFTPPSPAPVVHGKKRPAPDDSTEEPVSSVRRVARPGAPGNLLRRPHLISYPGKKRSPQQVLIS